ncbi:TIGR00730 family Rossman fold protein [Amphritea sp. HPY]|uniref:LOG family protein n=1 Tax=Amphritea sp. HPY TaxID=3421652 RepID=UPI003D7CDFF0
MKIAVYCGASSGRPDAAYAQQASRLGLSMAEQGIELVYGGAGVGLMGIIANAVLTAGGKVTGVMPAVLIEKEQAHAGLTELIRVDDIHQRKAKMMDLADAFVALPGGTGTLEELFEVWAWRQIGIHRKPFGLLNTDGYYDHLLRFLDHATEQSFVRPEYRRFLVAATEPELLLSELINAV